ncbi:hypothetical protein CWI38_0942p0010 [Hamiltosporidium tvaerminnensis]|uniref:Uncharacterized protein n=1 Tax=Hamiltosporidium tvaerminnensis TaxID=1176355 RepID=A0A4Q9LU04_9MICR|nr:hypothetical protein CWI38_1013p0030 [Hamiltosporidium tvaerminnensis]TBU12004.1 hypothetical protein CWI38_0942p0010 [Hamiltosporidium tvaerminnensis]
MDKTEAMRCLKASIQMYMNIQKRTKLLRAALNQIETHEWNQQMNVKLTNEQKLLVSQKKNVTLLLTEMEDLSKLDMDEEYLFKGKMTSTDMLNECIAALSDSLDDFKVEFSEEYRAIHLKDDDYINGKIEQKSSEKEEIPFVIDGLTTKLNLNEYSPIESVKNVMDKLNDLCLSDEEPEKSSEGHFETKEEKKTIQKQDSFKSEEKKIQKNKKAFIKQNKIPLKETDSTKVNNALKQFEKNLETQKTSNLQLNSHEKSSSSVTAKKNVTDKFRNDYRENKRDTNYENTKNKKILKPDFENPNFKKQYDNKGYQYRRRPSNPNNEVLERKKSFDEHSTSFGNNSSRNIGNYENKNEFYPRNNRSNRNFYYKKNFNTDIPSKNYKTSGRYNNSSTNISTNDDTKSPKNTLFDLKTEKDNE